MDRNVKIAKQLVKIAKSLICASYRKKDYAGLTKEDYDRFHKNKFSQVYEYDRKMIFPKIDDVIVNRKPLKDCIDDRTREEIEADKFALRIVISGNYVADYKYNAIERKYHFDGFDKERVELRELCKIFIYGVDTSNSVIEIPSYGLKIDKGNFEITDINKYLNKVKTYQYIPNIIDDRYICMHCHEDNVKRKEQRRNTLDYPD